MRNSTGGLSISPSLACPSNGSPSREREEAARGPVPEPARAEVHADPHPALLVLEEVHVVVAGADRPELLGREVVELALRREVRDLDRVQHLVIHGLVVLAPDAEADAREDRVHDPAQVGADLVGPQVRARGLVAAVVDDDAAGQEALGGIAGHDVVDGRDLTRRLVREHGQPRDLAGVVGSSSQTRAAHRQRNGRRRGGAEPGGGADPLRQRPAVPDLPLVSENLGRSTLEPHPRRNLQVEPEFIEHPLRQPKLGQASALSAHQRRKARGEAPVFLVADADERRAGNRVSDAQFVGAAPAEPRAHTVIVGETELAAERERDPAERTCPAGERADARCDDAEARRVPAEHGLAGGNGLDRPPVAVRGRDRRSRREARDVVSDPGRADVVGVGDGAADRLGVADVAVGAERAAQGVAGVGAALELGDGALVDVAVDRDRSGHRNRAR